MKKFDCIAVGAGYAGAVFARCAADAIVYNEYFISGKNC